MKIKLEGKQTIYTETDVDLWKAAAMTAEAARRLFGIKSTQWIDKNGMVVEDAYYAAGSSTNKVLGRATAEQIKACRVTDDFLNLVKKGLSK